MHSFSSPFALPSRTLCAHSRPRSSLLFIMHNVHRRGHFIYRRDTRAHPRPGHSIHEHPFLVLSRPPPSPFYPLAVPSSPRTRQCDTRHTTTERTLLPLRFHFPRRCTFFQRATPFPPRGKGEGPKQEKGVIVLRKRRYPDKCSVARTTMLSPSRVATPITHAKTIPHTWRDPVVLHRG